MAELYEDDDDTREAWLAWALEFARRGLRVGEEITVHGPHAPPADRMWGEAECQLLNPDGSFALECEVEFDTPPCNSIWDIRGVRVRTKGELGEQWPVLPAEQLPDNLREWIKEAKEELAELRATAEAERREVRRVRELPMGQRGDERRGWDRDPSEFRVHNPWLGKPTIHRESKGVPDGADHLPNPGGGIIECHCGHRWDAKVGGRKGDLTHGTIGLLAVTCPQCDMQGYVRESEWWRK